MQKNYHCKFDINMGPNRPETDNDHNDNSSSSSATDEDETDPSSLLDHDISPEKAAENEKRRTAFIEQEEKHVRNVRRALAVAILICAVVVSSSVYVLARRSEYHSFTHEVCCCCILLYWKRTGLIKPLTPSRTMNFCRFYSV